MEWLTSIPTHNLGEVIDGVKAMIRKSDITTEELMKYIKGPDFPTGGIVANEKELRRYLRDRTGEKSAFGVRWKWSQ